MNGKIRSLAILAMSLMLGAGGTAQAVQFSAMMSETLVDPFGDPMTYNGNTPNGIPTPQSGLDPGMDLFNAANRLNPGGFATPSGRTASFTRNSNLDSRLVTQDHSFETLDGSVVSLFVISKGAANKNDLGFYTRTDNGANFIVKSSPLLTDVTGFGYTGDGSSAATAYQGVQFTAPVGAPAIGFYIESKSWRTNFTTSNTFYSESQFNPDASVAGGPYDHLITYALPELKGLTYWFDPDGDGPQAAYKYTFSDKAYMIGFKDSLARLKYDPAHPEYGITLGDDDYNDLIILVDSAFIKPSDKPPLVPEPSTFALVGSGLAGLWMMIRRKRS